MAELEEKTNTMPSDDVAETTPKPAVERNLYQKQEKTDKPYWYVIYTYSGYENKVMTNLLKTVENHGLQDTIIDVKVCSPCNRAPTPPTAPSPMPTNSI